jgi:TolA-binding protein
MRPWHIAFGVFFAVALGVVLEPAKAMAQPFPMPRRVADDDSDSFSPLDFERMLQKLKAEREGLSSDWQALRKRNTVPEPSLESEQKRFELHLQKALEDLKKRRLPPLPAPPVAPDGAKKPTEHETTENKKPAAVESPPDGPGEKTVGPVDVMAQAHTLMRSKQYEEALATFQQIDLKGKKINERGPIQYLKACCLLHLGKSKDAAELLQEVANYKGDEKLAGYAQTQLEMLRWQRDVAQRLQDIRQRYQALEGTR